MKVNLVLYDAQAANADSACPWEVGQFEKSLPRWRVGSDGLNGGRKADAER
jgi:hypothetical protein